MRGWGRGTGIFCSVTGYDVVRMLAGGLLLVAAGLKGCQLAAGPVLEHSWLDARWLLIVTVEFELLFGLWLVAGLWPKRTWAMAIACFGLFAVVSLHKAILGHASCGCFGRGQINPWYTTLLDSAIVGSLLYWPPRGSQPAVPAWLNRLAVRAIAVFAIWLSVGIPAALAMWNPSVALLESVFSRLG